MSNGAPRASHGSSSQPRSDEPANTLNLSSTAGHSPHPRHLQRHHREYREQAELFQSPRPPRRRSGQEIVQDILDDRQWTDDISPSGELYRAIERYQYRDSADLQPSEAAATTQRSETTRTDSTRDLQRRFLMDPRGGDRAWAAAEQQNVTSSRPSVPRRSGASPYYTMPHPRSSRYRPTQRDADRYRLPASLDTGIPFAQLLGQGDSVQQLQDILDDATSSLGLSVPPSTSVPLESSSDSRQNKRRKLESDMQGSKFKAVTYGKYGQVVPGQLRMEIESCDGGQFSLNESYAADNILRDDNSVYCTKSNRCNIVLRHQGSTVFSLKELIIKAPGANYSSPVREGMIFISMDSDDLLARTARYQIQYEDAKDTAAANTERRALAPVSIRHHEDGSTTRTRHVVETRARRNGEQQQGGEDIQRVARIPSAFQMPPPPFTIETTQDCDDEDEYDGRRTHSGPSSATLHRLNIPPPPSSASRLVPPNRIGTLPFESDDGEDTYPDLTRTVITATAANPDNRDTANNDEEEVDWHADPWEASDAALALAQAEEASRIATQDAVDAVGGKLMVPHAKFWFDKDQKKCTIRFDPPVTGRFILVKMWNPHHDPGRNIDIQGIVAKGFAGPRLFPSVQLR